MSAKGKNINLKNILTLEKFKQIDCLCIDKSEILTNFDQVHTLWYDNLIKKASDNSNKSSSTFETLRMCALLAS